MAVATRQPNDTLTATPLFRAGNDVFALHGFERRMEGMVVTGPIGIVDGEMKDLWHRFLFLFILGFCFVYDIGLFLFFMLDMLETRTN